MTTRRHSRETFQTLLLWYSSWGLLGVASLILVAAATRLLGYERLTPDQAVIGLLMLAPFTITIFVYAWRRVAPILRQQRIKATYAEHDGLSMLRELESERRKQKPQ